MKCASAKMRLWQIAISFHVALFERLSSIRAETVYEVAEGGNITVQCSFYVGGYEKIFCKNNCDEQRNVLVKTRGNTACEERYCIHYDRRGTLESNIMSVNMSKVTDADSGTYQCVLRRSLIKDGVETFRIKVTNNPDAAVNPTFTLRPERSPPVSVKPSSGDVSTVAAEDQSVSRDPHSSTPEHQQNKEPGSTLLFAGVTLAALVLLLAAVLLIFCRKIKGHMSKELPVSVDDRDDYEASHRSYEEIGPGVVSRPVEVSTVYASASFSKMTEDPADLYSLATAPGNQQQEEDDPSYTQIHFPIGPGGNSAPQSQSKTLYSVVQHRPVDSLYSTAAFSQ